MTIDGSKILLTRNVTLRITLQLTAFCHNTHKIQDLHRSEVSSPSIARLAQDIPCACFRTQLVRVIQSLSTHQETNLVVTVPIVAMDQMRPGVDIPLLIRWNSCPETFHLWRWLSCI